MFSDSKKLEDLMLKQLKHLKALSDSAELKKQAIIQNKTDEIEKIASNESFIIAQIKEIEELRSQLLSEMATEEHPLNKMSIAEVAQCFEKKSSERIIKIQKAVKTLALEVQTRNRLNGELLLYAIDHFNSFFQTLFAHQNPPNVYTPKGIHAQEVVTSNMFLDKRA